MTGPTGPRALGLLAGSGPDAGDDNRLAAASATARNVAAAAAFPGTRDHIRLVRAFAARQLAGWPAADDAILCLSELAANAVVHSASGRPGGTFWVHVLAVPGQCIRVEVCDQGGPWVRRDAYTDRPHGLDIVRQLATEFGVDGDDVSGRIVWARINLPGSGAAHTADPGQPGEPIETAANDCPAQRSPACSQVRPPEHLSWPR